jgi:hypothetical protein
MHLSLQQSLFQVRLDGIVPLDPANLPDDTTRNATGVPLDDLMLAGLRRRAGVSDSDVIGPALEASRILLPESHRAGVQLRPHHIQIAQTTVRMQSILALVGKPLRTRLMELIAPVDPHLPVSLADLPHPLGLGIDTLLLYATRSAKACRRAR